MLCPSLQITGRIPLAKIMSLWFAILDIFMHRSHVFLLKITFQYKSRLRSDENLIPHYFSYKMNGFNKTLSEPLFWIQIQIWKGSMRQSLKQSQLWVFGLRLELNTKRQIRTYPFLSNSLSFESTSCFMGLHSGSISKSGPFVYFLQIIQLLFA